MDELERELVRIWSSVLGVDTVGLDDDFFELGGDSLAAVTVFDWVADATGNELPYSLMLELSTISQLAAHIRRGEGAVASLVAIQPCGSRIPLFVIHDLRGGIFFAKHLARHLGAQQPVYALRPPEGPGVTLEDFTFVGLAAHYVAEVRRARPNGPYRLYGFSFGGLLAFEMAVQLQREGQTVDFLAIGDTLAPSISLKPTMSGDLDSILLGEVPPAFSVRVRRHLSTWRRMPRRQAAIEAVKLLGQGGDAVRLIRWRIGSDERERRARSYRERQLPQKLVTLNRGYRPSRRFEGSIVLVRTDDDFATWGVRAAADRGWGEHATMEVRTVRVSCGHYEMADEPGIREVAEVIGRALGEGTITLRPSVS